MIQFLNILNFNLIVTRRLEPFVVISFHTLITHGLSHSFDAPADSDEAALRRIQRLPELVKSFFRQLDCEYAAM